MSVSIALQRFFEQVGYRLRLPRNAQNKLLGTRLNDFVAVPTIVETGIVTSDDELDRQRGYRESFEDVFNNWTRISRQAGIEGDAANADELSAWTYDGDNTLRCTMNTASLVGFISSAYYDDFVLETRLSSVDSDDDFIGLCIAFAQDRDGSTHTLTAMRQLNSTAPLVIEVDRNAFGGNGERFQLPVYGGLRWNADTVATDSAESTDTAGWSASPNGIMLRVTRRGDEITVETSQYDSLEYVESAKTTINLNDHSELERFKGPQRFGYVCLSQRDATWEVFRRPGEETLSIIDLRDYTLSKFVEGQWVDTPSDLETLLDKGELVENRLHLNVATGSIHYLDDQQTLTRF